MIVCLLKFGLGELLDRHSVAARVLLLVGLFFLGYAEAKILKSRGLASVTWLSALTAACIWSASRYAYPDSRWIRSISLRRYCYDRLVHKESTEGLR